MFEASGRLNRVAMWYTTLMQSSTPTQHFISGNELVYLSIRPNILEYTLVLQLPTGKTALPTKISSALPGRVILSQKTRSTRENILKSNENCLSQ